MFGIYPIAVEQQQFGCLVQLGTLLHSEGLFICMEDAEERIRQLEAADPDAKFTAAQVIRCSQCN